MVGALDSNHSKMREIRVSVMHTKCVSILNVVSEGTNKQYHIDNV